MQPLMSSACFTLICLLVFVLLKPFDKRLWWPSGLLFALYIGADDVVTSLPSITSAAIFIDGNWNWEGKIFSLALSLIVIYAIKVDRHAVGLTLTQRNLGKSLIALVLLTFFSLTLGFVFKPGVPDIETLAFQASMPGLAEELAYRGIAPVLLLGLINSKLKFDGMPWTVILITALCFGVWHGLSFSDGQLRFDYMSALFPFIGGLAYGWLRFNSGSLLFPILAHSLGNSAFALSAYIFAQ